MNESTDNRQSLIMSEIMTPEKANFAGNIHGGHLMEMLDRVAYACAARYSSCYVVTLSADRILFRKPIHVGELVTCYANINYVGHSSMEVGIKVTAENLISGETRHTNSCYFTMVALDENHNTTTVPPLTLDTAMQKRRQEEAKLRRTLRQQFDQQHAKHKAEIRDQYQ